MEDMAADTSEYISVISHYAIMVSAVLKQSLSGRFLA
jgi:hypothetical protein